MKRMKRILSALLTLLLLTGCAQAPAAQSQEPEPTAATETAEPATEETAEPVSQATTEPDTEAAPAAQLQEPYVFNPHAYSCFLEACYSEEYREGFFSLCDALQQGGDSFPCASEEVYRFCMDGAVLNQLYPVACVQITDQSPDGSPSWEDGTGRIWYTKSKEDFLQRQSRFVSDVEAIMNQYIRSDYSPFERCLALYEYIAKNYRYDYGGEMDCSEDGSGYACLKNKMGICADFAPWYGYLLMQCGVDAIAVSNDGTEDSPGYHSWTFVDIGGEGYHIDATWGLTEDTEAETFPLDYFMMTDEDRAESGYPAELTEVFILPEFYAKDCQQYDFIADDTAYRLPDWSECSRYDASENILYYYNWTIDEAERSFRYE